MTGRGLLWPEEAAALGNGNTGTWKAGWERYLSVAVAVLVALRSAWVFSFPLRSPALRMGLAQDDFYYYLKTAQNLAWHHRSEAFPHVLTNGYHPLYFALIAALSVFVRTLPGMFRCLWVVDTVSAVAIFLLTRRLFAAVASTVTANALAVVMTALCSIQICHQMEVTLALPLGFAFLLAGFVDPARITVRRAAVMGLLGALTFLARLDAGLIVLLYALGCVADAEFRKAVPVRQAGAFLLTCLPLPLLYFWVNEHYFQRLLPISGLAKQLRHGHMPSRLLLRTFLGTNFWLAVVVVVGIVLAYALRKQLSRREKVFVFAVLADPIVFYGTESLVSDWPVWPWYFYALRFSAAGVLVLGCVLAKRLPRPEPSNALFRLRLAAVLPTLLLAGAVFKLCRMGYHVDPWMVETQHAAEVLSGFATSHPGAYAMGDRAGMFLYASREPVLQVEGLMMDARYLEHMRAQDNLRQVLGEYGVRYYVALVPDWSRPWQFKDGCFHAFEPLLAGPMAMHMRADFCGAAVYEFPGFDGTYVIYKV